MTTLQPLEKERQEYFEALVEKAVTDTVATRISTSGPSDPKKTLSAHAIILSAQTQKTQ